MTSTSLCQISISSMLHVLGKNYDESIALTSKYNQVSSLNNYLYLIKVKKNERIVIILS